MPPLNDTLSRAATRAAEPVRVPWRAPLTGFVVGFLAAVLPAAFVTRAFSVRGDRGVTFALVHALAVGLATAVCRAARP
jgi:hypothetical protein